MKKPITQADIRELRRATKRLEAENRQLGNENRSLRRSFFSFGSHWVAATSGESDAVMSAVRTAKRLGFAVGVRASDNENRLDFYAIPMEAPRNV